MARLLPHVSMGCSDAVRLVSMKHNNLWQAGLCLSLTDLFAWPGPPWAAPVGALAQRQHLSNQTRPLQIVPDCAPPVFSRWEVALAVCLSLFGQGSLEALLQAWWHATRCCSAWPGAAPGTPPCGERFSKTAALSKCSIGVASDVETCLRRTSGAGPPGKHAGELNHHLLTTWLHPTLREGSQKDCWAELRPPHVWLGLLSAEP